VQANLNARTLPSKVFNPTRGNYTMIGINIHDGGELPKGAKPDPKNPYSGTNFSKGCITIKKSDYPKFIDIFEINEFVEIIIA
ncbi:MAG: hypothetical protein NZM44_06580, partial [Candidatus Calescibacterium sp.]|nr:hypothetical protein [Candidatus Calescibacterium sp.]